MRLVLILGLLLYVVQAHSQTPVDDQSDRATNFSDVAGSPYLFRDWSDGLVRFSSGRLVNQFKLKFDCAQNKLMLQFNGSTFSAESKISEFVILQKNGRKTDSLVFRKGFPKSGLATEETFYQVLTEGPITLLHLFSKNIVEEKQIANAATRRYQDDNKIFLLKNQQLIPVSRDKHVLAELLADKSDELKRFIDENDLKMKSAADMTRVVQKYNELIQ
jgi:hypothetical protein